MTRKEEIKKEYGYIEVAGTCKECKFLGIADVCHKIGIMISCNGSCRKFDKATI